MCRAYSTNGPNRNAYRILVGKPQRKRPLGRVSRKWVSNIKLDLREMKWDVWIGFIWLRIGTSGGLLWTRQWTFGFHKTLGSSWVAAQLAASQEGLSSMSEWVPHSKLNSYKCTVISCLYVLFFCLCQTDKLSKWDWLVELNEWMTNQFHNIQLKTNCMERSPSWEISCQSSDHYYA
jgi:hypothetical protein